MIKKIFIFIFLLIIILLSFIFYKESNKYKLTQEYKIEIEKLINEETPKTKHCIDEYYQKAQNEYLKIKNAKGSEYLESSVLLIDNYQRAIEVCEFNMVSMLVEKTENYANIKDKIPATDFAGTLNEFLFPYLNANNINYKELTEISKYANTKINEVNNFSYQSLSADDIYK